ncbi:MULTISPECIES: hypothetical protein [unclassified Roseovarius]|uniref:hypothetical protein n=1 Tax=unclassified Roseovarius TaxID=2614913 RepID=UPI00273F683B|nr:hypothetical protein [Roseovarius sp. MMSF_3350]
MTVERNENREGLNETVVLELWKKTVDVQQHFNDLELRIRNFALIVVGALLALGGYAVRESVTVSILGISLSAAGLIIWSSLIPLAAFYFMDRWWYHRLLKGAVMAGIPLEAKLKEMGYPVALGEEISKSSPFEWRLWGRKGEGDETSFWKFPKRKMHSEYKMDFFYLALGLAIFVVGFSLINVAEIEASSPDHTQKVTDQN